MTLHEQHKARHETLHAALDELIADYLSCHRDALPSTTTALALIEWSHRQTINPDEPPESSVCAACGELLGEGHQCDASEPAPAAGCRVAVAGTVAMSFSRNAPRRLLSRKGCALSAQEAA